MSCIKMIKDKKTSQEDKVLLYTIQNPSSILPLSHFVWGADCPGVPGSPEEQRNRHKLNSSTANVMQAQLTQRAEETIRKLTWKDV